MTAVKSDDAEAQGVEEITREEERGAGDMTDENVDGTTRKIQ